MCVILSGYGGTFNSVSLCPRDWHPPTSMPCTVTMLLVIFVIWLVEYLVKLQEVTEGPRDAGVPVEIL